MEKDNESKELLYFPKTEHIFNLEKQKTLFNQTAFSIDNCLDVSISTGAAKRRDVWCCLYGKQQPSYWPIPGDFH